MLLYDLPVAPLGCGEAGVVNSLLGVFDEEEVRVSATFPQGDRLHMATRVRAHSELIDSQVATASLGVSATGGPKDFAGARKEIDRATDLSWKRCRLSVAGNMISGSYISLLSGGWAVIANAEGMGIYIGSGSRCPLNLHFITLKSADLLRGL